MVLYKIHLHRYIYACIYRYVYRYLYKDSHKRAKKMVFHIYYFSAIEKNRMNGWLVEEDNNKNVYEGTKK